MASASANKGIPPNERRIMLVGKTGNGKSSTGNALLGKDFFQAKTSGHSVTKKTKHGEVDRFGRHLVVVDTPGIMDTDNDSVIEEIMKFHGLVSPGLHAVIFVVRISRITDEDIATLKYFLKCFGHEVIKHTMIVFTGKYQLDDTLEKFVNEMTNVDFKRLFKKIKKRYVSIGHSKKVTKEVTEEREEEIQEILEMIDSIIGVNGDTFYSNDAFRMAEKIILAEIETMEKKRKARLENLHISGEVSTGKVESENINPRSKIRQDIEDGMAEWFINCLKKSAWFIFETIALAVLVPIAVVGAVFDSD